LLGVVTVSPVTKRGKELAPILRTVQILGGGVASPWDSWLTLRGLRTLQLRVVKQCTNAMQLAEYFNNKSNPLTKEMITAVHYPGLACHPQHDVATKQMDGGLYGGVLSIELEDEVAAMAFAGALQTIQRATSLGGTETLIEHRSSIEPPTRQTSPKGLLRISVGLEDINDLLQDCEFALATASEVISMCR
jgi:cystathionine gamma-synthase